MKHKIKTLIIFMLSLNFTNLQANESIDEHKGFNPIDQNLYIKDQNSYLYIINDNHNYYKEILLDKNNIQNFEYENSIFNLQDILDNNPQLNISDKNQINDFIEQLKTIEEYSIQEKFNIINNIKKFLIKSNLIFSSNKKFNLIELELEFYDSGSNEKKLFFTEFKKNITVRKYEAQNNNNETTFISLPEVTTNNFSFYFNFNENTGCFTNNYKGFINNKYIICNLSKMK